MTGVQDVCSSDLAEGNVGYGDAGAHPVEGTVLGNGKPVGVGQRGIPGDLAEKGDV